MLVNAHYFRAVKSSKLGVQDLCVSPVLVLLILHISFSEKHIFSLVTEKHICSLIAEIQAFKVNKHFGTIYMKPFH